MNNVIEKSIRCDCIGGEHYLNFMLFTDTDGRQELTVDLYAKSRPWGKHKWQMVWNIIKGKDICYDGIILERSKQDEIVDFLDSIPPEKLVDVELPPNND